MVKTTAIVKLTRQGLRRLRGKVARFRAVLDSNLLNNEGCSHRKGGYVLLWKEFDPKLTAVRFQPSVQSASS